MQYQPPEMESGLDHLRAMGLAVLEIIVTVLGWIVVGILWVAAFVIYPVLVLVGLSSLGGALLDDGDNIGAGGDFDPGGDLEIDPAAVEVDESVPPQGS